jgi:chromosome segregation ATPase
MTTISRLIPQAYVRDLEEKLKAYDETCISSSESMTDLKREVIRFKEAEALSSKYITDLEARLSRSDDSILVLQQNVEELEKECDRRRNEIETLQTRLETFRQDGENWRSDLEARELKVKQLEEKMLEWEQKRKDTAEIRLRLGEVVEEVVSARRSLEVDLANVPSPANASECSKTPSDSISSPSSLPEADTTEMPSIPSPSEIEAQLFALQQTHTATLADLSSVTTKYRDALREISDLAAQIQEAKLSSPSIAESSSDSPDTDKLQDIPTPPLRKRMTSPRVRETLEVQLNPSSRRLFFRQAASAESLHAR